MGKPYSKTLTTQERLREMFDYDPEVGLFKRRLFAGGEVAGSIAGHKKRDGYIAIYLDYRLYLAHRLAWLYVYGAWPTRGLDHINRVRDDNRIANLREATAALNNVNFGEECRTRNKLGVLGVYFYKGKFVAQIGNGTGSVRYLGRYTTADEASAVYQKARTERDAARLAAETTSSPDPFSAGPLPSCAG